jgi:hypothetical protein
MKRGIVAIALLMGIGIVACVDTEEAPAFYIVRTLALTPQEQCIVNPESKIHLNSGVMDVMFTNRYFLYPAVQNFLGATSSAEYGEVNNIQITSAEISYEFPPNLAPATKAVLDETYHTFLGTSVPPDGVVGAEILAIPPQVGNALRADDFSKDGYGLVVFARLEGRMADGTVIHSNEFSFPIDVCFGCLYMVMSNNCCDTEQAQSVKWPCRLGQDGGVDCRIPSMMGKACDPFSNPQHQDLFEF